MYIPTAIVLSNLDIQGNIPGSSSTPGLSLLEPGLDVGLAVVKETIRADGKL
jgi:hypothetical protein